MTGLQKETGVEYPRLNIEEVETMPLRKGPYCKGLCQFVVGQPSGFPDSPVSVRLDICANCHKPVYFRYPSGGKIDLTDDMYPKMEAEPDQELPDDVQTAFREAIEALNEGIWNGCVTMCRRALEEAMTDLEAEGADLFHQIDDLESKRRITPELKEWAHEGRLGGKLGAHGIKEKKWEDQNDAEEVLEFCRWFLRYLYVLPKQLADRKERLSKQSASQARHEHIA